MKNVDVISGNIHRNNERYKPCETGGGIKDILFCIGG